MYLDMDFHEDDPKFLSPYHIVYNVLVTGPNYSETYTDLVNNTSSVYLGTALEGFTISVTYDTYHSGDLFDNTGLEDAVCHDSYTKTFVPCDLPSNQITIEDIITTEATPGPGNYDGMATVTVSGGSIPYLVSLTDASGNILLNEEMFAATFVFSNLGVGDYTVIVYCDPGPDQVEVERYFEILPGDCSEFVPCTPITITGTVTNESNSGAADGSITINNTNLLLNWDDLNSWTENTVRSNLPAGTYCVTGIDPSCCEDYVCFEIEAVCNIDIYYQVEAACDGENNGVAFASPQGGTPPYNYYWSNGNTTSSLIGVAAGTYTVSVWDSEGCFANQTIEIPTMTDDMLTVLVDHATGSLDVLFNGSISIVTWYGPGINANNQSDISLTGLRRTGQYCVTVETEFGCKLYHCVNLNTPLEIEPIIQGCDGGVAPFVCTSATGGTPGYFYEWSDNVITELGSCASVLSGDEYCVTVSDNDPISPQTVSACWEVPELEASVLSSQSPCPGQNNGQICMQASGGANYYKYKWLPNTAPSVNPCSPSTLAGGMTYLVTVTDLCGSEVLVPHYLPDNYVNPSVASHEMEKACLGSSNGSLSLDVVGGSSNMTYSWTGGSSNNVTTIEPILENISAGLYWVTINHACGSEQFGFYLVENYSNDEPSIDLNWDIIPDCKYGQTNEGAISFIESGNNGPLTFEWSTGATTSSISGLEAGSYWVVISQDNGCQTVDIVDVPSLGNFITGVNGTNTCGNNSTGSLEVLLEPGDYNIAWSNGGTTAEITGLDAGTYTVTVSDTEFGCRDVHSYQIIDGNNDPNFDYEVFVQRHFDSDYSNPSAVVWIDSDYFEDWGKIILDNDADVWDWTYENGVQYPAKLIIPIAYQNFSTFNFTFISPDGCEYQGSFGGIPTCSDNDNDNYSIQVDHIGDVEDVCGTYDEHSYDIHVNQIGNNLPYFLEVSMIEAHDPADQNYIAVYQYTGQTDFTVNGVPDGSVRFRTYNNCHFGNFNNHVYTNCCSNLSCEILDQGYDGDDQGPWDDNYFYEFDFFELYIRDLCFDGSCGDAFQDCSEIVPTLDQQPFIPVNNCWYGEVTIDYPSGPSAVFRVDPDDNDNDVYDEVYWTNEQDWRPDNPGTYNITITYNGDNNQGSGSDCTKTIEVTFYGSANYSDIVGFNDDYYPDSSMDAYHGAWKCNRCGGSKYVFHNDQGECDEYFNWEFTHFNFSPINYDNACNFGGILTIMDFDNAGVANIQTVIIPPNTALAEFPGLQAFDSPQGEWCDRSGWCHFDGNVIYGINSFDKPILATWFDAQSCEPQGPTNNPCSESNPCLVGECEDGECVEVEDCEPDCPDCEPNCDDDPTCLDDCDCEEGFYCDGDDCVPFNNGDDCNEPCQCPENYDCVNNICEFVGCGTCPSGQFCDNNECINCPQYSAQFCFGNASCGSATNCIMEVYMTSTVNDVFVIKLFRDGELVNSANKSLWASPQLVFQEVVPQDCPPDNGFFYTVKISIEGCTTETFSAPELYACTTGCFTGGADDRFNTNSEEQDSEINKPSYQVFPNPFSDILNLECQAKNKGAINISVLNVLGEVLYTEMQTVTPGLNKMNIDLDENIPIGVLYLNVEDEKGDVQTFKVVKVKKDN